MPSAARVREPAVRAHLAALLFYVLLFLAFFGPALSRGLLLAPRGDGAGYYLPHYLAPRTTWSTTILSGFPVAADPEAMMWYPPRLLLSPIADSWNAFVIFGYVMASLGVFSFVEALTRSWRAGLLSGLAYGMSGFLMARLEHASIIHSAAWIPWMLRGIFQLRAGFHPGWWAATSATCALCVLGGHPQISVYAIGLTMLYAATTGVHATTGWRRYYLVSAVSLAAGIAITAVQVLPTLELAARTGRLEMSFTQFVVPHIPRTQLAILVFPYLFGGAGNGPYGTTRIVSSASEGGLPYVGAWENGSISGYIGLIPLMMGVIGTCVGVPRREAWFWTVVAAASILLALGAQTPLAWGMYHLPGYRVFRAPARHLLGFDLSIAVLCGLGLAVLESAERPARVDWVRRGAGVVLGLTAMLAVGVYTKRARFEDAFAAAGVEAWSAVPWRNPCLGIPLLLAAASAGALLLYARRSAPSRFGLLFLLLATDLAAFGWSAPKMPFLPTREDLDLPAPLAKYRAEIRRTHQRVAPNDGYWDSWYARLNVPLLWELSTAAGDTSLLPRRYGDLMENRDSFRPAALGAADRTLDVLAVRYLLRPTGNRAVFRSGGERVSVFGGAQRQPPASHPPDLDPVRWRRVEDLPELTIYENSRVMPRAWLTSSTRMVSPADALAALRTGTLPDGTAFDPARIALVEEPTTAIPADADGSGVARVLELGATTLSIRTDSPHPSFLVVSDTFDPGWMVTVDGKPGRLVQTDYVLRGVSLPPGRHDVRFEFRPRLSWVATALSALATAAVGLIAARPYLARRASPLARARRSTPRHRRPSCRAITTAPPQDRGSASPRRGQSRPSVRSYTRLRGRSGATHRTGTGDTAPHGSVLQRPAAHSSPRTSARTTRWWAFGRRQRCASARSRCRCKARSAEGPTRSPSGLGGP
jgi:hypothetical protein